MSYENKNYHFSSPTYQNVYRPSQRVKTEHHVSFKEVGENLVGREIASNGKTSYQDHYNRQFDREFLKAVNPQKQYRQPQYVRPSYKFEGQSRYRSDFIDSPYMEKIRITNSQKVNRNREQLQPTHFEGNSSYKQQFKPYIIQFRPSKSTFYQMNIACPIKLDSMTSYKDDYRKFTIREEVRCPVEKLPVPRVNTQKGQRHLYYNAETNTFA